MSELKSITGEHPSSWEVFALRDLGEIKNGPTQLKKSLAVRRQGVPVISPAEIADGHVLIDRAGRIAFDEAQKFDRHRLQAGDVIMVRTGGRRGHALVTAQQAEEGPLLDSSCIRIRARRDQLLPEYLNRYLAHPAVREWLERRDHTGVLVHRNGRVLAELPVLVPPVEEQEAMGEMFAALEEKIRVHQEIVEVTRRLQEEVTQAVLRPMR